MSNIRVATEAFKKLKWKLISTNNYIYFTRLERLIILYKR